MFKYQIDESLHLSLLETRDAEALYRLIDRNRAYIGEWLKFPSMTLHADDSRAFIERTRLRFAKDDGYWLGIWDNNQLVGSIGYLYINQDDRKTEIGYWLGQEFEGRGIITRSIRALINYAFSELHLNKIEIGAASSNTRSRAIAERLGFQCEGELRDYEFINGRYLNRVIYGLKSSEWRSEKLIAAGLDQHGYKEET
ncbi:ribosomal-protein-serine acetyltransferase [Paenibacillus cellulosilyticus]|uniref:Ribosomal-protein-serine acetyltransferase n=1 Tax=Paenibacillus cellulosilyticus TaxID=375489 RepID=A0A2V2YLJ9_9BACL|nr:GNAT family protein [Paenibacillus cellulosilyticus]PWV94495.1 ribosomal-protein-serine acetyltransferase [Paenibacillus cellulosilyticus]QKS45005.1 GNAT family N-acetyltransferase [Paenibacillus cellulosilyticus]